MKAHPLLPGRRRALAALGGAGLALVAPGVAACVVRPAQSEGPYFVEDALRRADLRLDPAGKGAIAGMPLRVAFRVSRIAGNRCTPLAQARVDLWQCDALGEYDSVRGWQVTDAEGGVAFTTIYPGWYPGRTTHLHFKVRTAREEFTSQLYFDDKLTDRVYTLAPYASRPRRRVRNEDDGLFARGGERLMLSPVERGEGYVAQFDLALYQA